MSSLLLLISLLAASPIDCSKEVYLAAGARSPCPGVLLSQGAWLETRKLQVREVDLRGDVGILKKELAWERTKHAGAKAASAALISDQREQLDRRVEPATRPFIEHPIVVATITAVVVVALTYAPQK